MKVILYYAHGKRNMSVELGYSLPRIPVEGDEIFYTGTYFRVNRVLFNLDELIVRVFLSLI